MSLDRNSVEHVWPLVTQQLQDCVFSGKSDLWVYNEVILHPWLACLHTHSMHPTHRVSFNNAKKYVNGIPGFKKSDTCTNIRISWWRCSPMAHQTTTFFGSCVERTLPLEPVWVSAAHSWKGYENNFMNDMKMIMIWKFNNDMKIVLKKLFASTRSASGRVLFSIHFLIVHLTQPLRFPNSPSRFTVIATQQM